MKTKTLFLAGLLTAALTVEVGTPGVAVAAPRRTDNPDVCLVNGSLNTLVMHNVAPLSVGRSTPLRGTYFRSQGFGVAPFEGSAMMMADGTVRIGLFVHSSAARQFDPNVPQTFVNDFTLSGSTDASFAGVLNFDNDGDYVPNGTISFTVADCATILIP